MRRSNRKTDRPVRICAITLLAMVSGARADVPNDDCASAQVVSDGAPAVQGNNAASSTPDDAEASCRASDYDAWFEYVATCTGAATVDTFGSGQQDTVLSVYDACGGNEIACNDDTGGPHSLVLFAVTSGQSYWIRLASVGVPGDYDLNITCTSVPGNDNCDSAIPVTDGVPAAQGDNTGAVAPDDAEAGCRASDNDVWFEYVATCTGAVTVDTFGSGQEDTVLSVHDACGGNEIACNDDTAGTLSQVTLACTAGQSYWIRLATIGLPGDYDLNISCSGVPGNDNCASAMVITNGVPAAEGDNTGAVAADDAEASCGASDNDVWFKYVATCTGAAIVDTFGSGQKDTVLSVYDACGGNELACNDDTGDTLSLVSFAVTFGRSYWVRLASIGVPGDYDLNIRCGGVPANDSCTTATLVTNGEPAVEGDNSAALAPDDAEATCRASDSDVWFEYVATCTGAATVDTFGSGQEDTVLSVYDACGGDEIVCDDDTGGTLSRVFFAVTSGQSYWIRLASIGVPGDYDLNIKCTSAPTNDNCASARTVVDGVPATKGDNTGAIAADDAEASCWASDYDVWFKYVAYCTGTATVDTFNSKQKDTVLSVYDACGGNEIACNDDTEGPLSQVLFAVTSGQYYWIRLGSVEVPGDYDLNITCGGVPVNDSCTTGTLVTDGAPAVEGDNSGAVAPDDGEASCRASHDDVWFEYVATCTGAATVDTFGSGQEDTVLSVYDACDGNEMVCNDDTGGTLSRVLFAVTSGQSYWIRLASIGVPGDYDLNIRCASVPASDNCASAIIVTDGVPAWKGDNKGTVAPDDAEASCGLSDNDVWFEYVATCTGAATVDTFGSKQKDTVLSIYDACGGSEIACNDDAVGDILSLVSFAVRSGRSYWIRLASFGFPGDYDLNITCESMRDNDSCSTAAAVSDGVPAIEGHNSGAIAPDDAEASCRLADFDVWFEYVATCTGAATVDTFGSEQKDTVLSVYDACGGSEIACNDDTSGPLSQVLFAVTAGQSYQIRLASIEVPGDYDLNITCDGVPNNDDCASAIVVKDGDPAAEGDNSGADPIDDAEASCRASDSDAWFEYVATCTGSAIVDTFGSGQKDTVLSVYDACGGNEIACDDDTKGTLSQVLFAVTSGQSYWIRLASIGFPGDFDLNITCIGVPPNDDCTDARVVTDGMPAVEGNNAGADPIDDAEALCRASDRDVWFEYVATCRGAVTVDTFGSGQEDTVLSVYNACGGPEIVCNDDSDGMLSEVTFFVANSGQTYWIRLASAGGPGDFDLNIKCVEILEIPTISEWGIVVLLLLLLSGLKILSVRHREAAT